LRAPTVDAAAALLVDEEENQVLFAKAPNAALPVASLTKLVSALVALQHVEPSHVVKVDRRAVLEKGEYGASSSLGLRTGERITVENLLYAMLLGSANDAALALAIDVSGSVPAFVREMNRWSRGHGLSGSRFASPTGLDDSGRSTADDLMSVVRLVQRSPLLSRMVSTRFREMPGSGKKTRRIQNRNVMLWLYPGATGMKTGSTLVAGYCLVVTANRDGRSLAVVVIGSPHEAFSTAGALLDHGFEGFDRHMFVKPGQDVGKIRIRGGAVHAAAGAALEALVPTADLDSVRLRLLANPAAAYPPIRGQRIGRLTVSLPGLRVGTVPLVAADVPAPDPPTNGSWWSRALRALVESIAQTIESFAS
jgi:D-alanyl-D-alanine carboxypeptidase (penicillin-binding protein 5/6)